MNKWTRGPRSQENLENESLNITLQPRKCALEARKKIENMRKEDIKLAESIIFDTRRKEKAAESTTSHSPVNCVKRWKMEDEKQEKKSKGNFVKFEMPEYPRIPDEIKISIQLILNSFHSIHGIALHSFEDEFHSIFPKIELEPKEYGYKDWEAMIRSPQLRDCVQIWKSHNVPYVKGLPLSRFKVALERSEDNSLWFMVPIRKNPTPENCQKDLKPTKEDNKDKDKDSPQEIMEVDPPNQSVSPQVRNETALGSSSKSNQTIRPVPPPPPVISLEPMQHSFIKSTTNFTGTSTGNVSGQTTPSATYHIPAQRRTLFNSTLQASTSTFATAQVSEKVSVASSSPATNIEVTSNNIPMQSFEQQRRQPSPDTNAHIRQLLKLAQEAKKEIAHTAPTNATTPNKQANGTSSNSIPNFAQAIFPHADNFNNKPLKKCPPPPSLSSECISDSVEASKLGVSLLLENFVGNFLKQKQQNEQAFFRRPELPAHWTECDSQYDDTYEQSNINTHPSVINLDGSDDEDDYDYRSFLQTCSVKKQNDNQSVYQAPIKSTTTSSTATQSGESSQATHAANSKKQDFYDRLQRQMTQHYNELRKPSRFSN